MTATEAALKMSNERGYVVIGFLIGGAGELLVIPGDSFREFAGELLIGYKLVVLERTNRADWDEQVVAMFGCKSFDKNPWKEKDPFYRCELKSDATATKIKDGPGREILAQG